jgi:hypothetical protein
MTNTKSFRRVSGKAVPWVPSKFDSFKLVKKGEYRSQKGSARSQVMELAKDGMLVGTWTKKCAEIGETSQFATNCIQKLMTTKAPGWTFSDKNAEGLTYEAVKSSRTLEKAASKEKAKAVKKAAPKRAPKKAAAKKSAKKEEQAAAAE